ncbi:hypothetical protein BDZ90DRAFT_208375, partial [Jaminaea rosea]
AAAATAVSAGPIMERTFGGSWSFSWGSYTEKAPWKDNSKPSWCHGEQISGIPTWSGGDWAKQCKTNPWAFWTMWYKPQWCKTGNKPKPIPSTPSTNPTCDGAYQVVFQDLQKQADTGVYAGQTVGAATVDNENYLTYGLATSVDGCLETCDKTEGCVFVNVYQDHVDNYPADVADLPESAQKKYAPGTLTCALYKACSDKDKATNFAGQQDPTKILNSDGYCKSGNC